jgi:hypothetical protein
MNSQIENEVILADHIDEMMATPKFNEYFDNFFKSGCQNDLSIKQMCAGFFLAGYAKALDDHDIKDEVISYSPSM